MIARHLKRMVWVLVAAACPVIALAQNAVQPNPGIAGQTLTLTAFLPGPGCLNRVASSSVTAVPGGIRVDYVVVPDPNAICGVPPSVVYFSLPIGPFAPGSYTVDLEGSTVGAVNAPIVVPFTVVAAPGAAISAPTLSMGGLLVLGLLIAGIASLKSFARASKKPLA